METATISVRYIGRKDWEADQWTQTGTVWPYPNALADMPADKALALVAQLPSEFEIVNEENGDPADTKKKAK